MCIAHDSPAGGFDHQALLHDTDEELLAVVTPFVEGAAAAGEPVLLTLSARSADLLRPVLPAGGDVTFMDNEVGYHRPAGTVRMLLEQFRAHVAQRPGRLHIVGEVPRSARASRWREWARYEAAVNELYADYPVSALCAYDSRTTPAAVLADVRDTHPQISAPDGRRASDRYTEPRAFLAAQPAADPDPLERTGPAAELDDPTPARARSIVTGLAARAELTRCDADDLLTAVSEVVANALLHGRAPTAVRGWAAPGRVVVTVSDSGPGPADPLAGLVPAGGGIGGLGLWLTHQLDVDVELIPAPEGFTVRLRSGHAPS